MILSQAFVIVNQGGDIIYVADAVTTIIGYDSRELIGRKAFDLLLTKVHYDLVLAHENFSLNLISPVRRKDGTFVQVEMKVRNLLHIKKVSGVLISLDPIS